MPAAQHARPPPTTHQGAIQDAVARGDASVATVATVATAHMHGGRAARGTVRVQLYISM